MTSPTLTPQVQPNPAITRPSDLLRPLVFFLLTLVSTTAVGMRYMHNFRLGLGPIMDDRDLLPYQWVLEHLRQVSLGVPFSLTLIAILLAHEFGHYFACRAFSVRSTLPYLLPAPTLSGTFGAVIRLRSRVRTRAALLVIGASGPIAGFIVLLFTTVVGLTCSTYATTPVLHGVQTPLLIAAADALLHLSHPLTLHPLNLIAPHPILVASWIGLLITALNLVPAGQLDGGHIVYALSPRVHAITTRIAVGVMLLLGIFFWLGWLVWAVVLLTPAMRHPRVLDPDPLQRRHWLMAAACLVIFFAASMYAPFENYGLLEVLRKLPSRMHSGW
jgi:Zn-dependent protease